MYSIRIYQLVWVLLLILGSASMQGQAQKEKQEGFNFTLTGRGLAATGNENPFWMYSNQYGRLDAQTGVLGLAQASFVAESRRLSFCSISSAAARPSLSDTP